MENLKHLFTSILFLLCSTVATAHEFEVNSIFYNITDETNKTVAVTYKGDSYYDYSYEYTGSVVIPENVTYNGNTYSVTSIGSSAFYGCSGLTSVTIPNSVTSIGGSAFRRCSGLIVVTIPNSVTSIGGRAFEDCTNLIIVTIGNSVTSIGDDAFRGCSRLRSIEIPNSVTSIGRNAFSQTKWYENQPDGVVYAGRVLYAYRGEMPENTRIMIKEGTSYITDYAFYNCSGLTSVTIPNSVTSIGDYAFRDCTGLTSITIPNSVTSIGSYAFEGCTGLTSITIPNSVTSIGDDAFYNTGWYNNQPDGILKLSKWVIGYKGTAPSGELNINKKEIGIADGAFKNCSDLTAVSIGNNITSIGGSAFYGCTGLTSVTIGNSVTIIGEDAFYDCDGLKEVHISDLSAWCNIEFGNIYTNPLFYANKLYLNGKLVTDLVIPDGISEIKNYAFEDCDGLTSVTIGNSVTSIGDHAFDGCSGLTSVTIGNSVTSIGDHAFDGCSGLTSVTIPNSVTSIGDYAFFYCDGLKEVHISDLSAWCNIEFGNSQANPLYYANKLYLNGELLTNLIIPDGVTKIKSCAFSGCDGLTSVTIPNSVTSIGDYAFFYCDGLKSIEIPGSVTSIGGSAFQACTGLTSVTIGNSVTSIGDYAFYGCSGLTSITIPNSVTSIGDYAFYYCSGLTSVTIPNSVTSIGGSAFYGCRGLTSITIPNSVTSIGRYAFEACTGLTSVTIPNSVTSIGSFAFYGCTGLKEIYVKSKTPIELNYDPFGSAIYDTTALIVPLGSKENYRTSDYWKNFKNIAEFDYDKEELYKEFSDWTSTNTDNSTTSSNSYTFEAVAGGKLSFDWEVSSEEGYDWFIVTLNGAEIVKESGEKSGSYEYTFTENGTYTLVAEYTKDDEYSEGGNYGKIYNIQLWLPLTDVEEIQTDDSFQSTKNVYYDLNGRKVENPTSGIYIINGKKVFVK